MKVLCLGCMKEYEGNFDICPYCGYKQDTPPKEAYHIMPGTMLRDQYIIGRVLGFGGFGITYIGFDMHLQKRVAIKEYFPSEFATRMPKETLVRIYAGEKREQFLAGMKKSLDEAQRLATFTQTPGITQIYDFFEENNTAYIVMELLEGETLKARLKRVGKMSVEEALPIVLSVLNALKAVHAKNIIHRDISPDNIYLLNSGEVKLIDFGAARQVTTTHSKSLTVILKLGYAPVEQYQSGGDQGPWTDVYALAATFYRMITGIRPPESPDRRMKDTLRDPSKLGISISENIENALMNALQVRIEDRTQSAEEFEKELYRDHVKRTQATKEKEDVGHWPLWIKILCGVMGIAIVSVGGLMVTGVIDSPMPVLPVFERKENTVWMPSLVNLSQDDARQKLESVGLQFEISGTEPSETIMEGYVLNQKDQNGNVLQAGEEVPSGSVIHVIISSGSGKTQIPDVLWMNEENGKKLLEKESLVAVNVEKDTDSKEKSGIITGISPEVGTEIELKDIITIHVAAGQESEEFGTVEVPSIVSEDQNQAKAVLDQNGLHIEKIALEYNVDVPIGQVMTQQPEAGTAVSVGSTVQVVVSKGPRQIYVMNVIGMEEDSAVEKLEDAGFDVLTDYDFNSDVEEGNVFSQSLTEGVFDEGTEITLMISQGTKPQVQERSYSRSEVYRLNHQNQSNQQTQVQTPRQTQAQPIPTTEPPKETEAPKQTEAPDPNRDPAFDRLQ